MGYIDEYRPFSLTSYLPLVVVDIRRSEPPLFSPVEVIVIKYVIKVRLSEDVRSGLFEKRLL